MSVDYRSGVVYGYKVSQQDLLDYYGEDADPPYDAEQEFDVYAAVEGNFWNEGAPEVVFHGSTKAYRSFGYNEYGFIGVDDLDASGKGLEQLMDTFDGELGFYAFHTVY